MLQPCAHELNLKYLQSLDCASGTNMYRQNLAPICDNLITTFMQDTLESSTLDTWPDCKLGARNSLLYSMIDFRLSTPMLLISLACMCQHLISNQKMPWPWLQFCHNTNVGVMSAEATGTLGWSFNTVGVLGEGQSRKPRSRVYEKAGWLRSLWLAAAITLMQNPVGLRDEGFFDNQHNDTWLYGGWGGPGFQGNYTSIINGTALALYANWQAYAEACAPSYCDITAQKTAVSRVVELFAVLGGAAAFFSFVISTILWPAFSWLAGWN